MVESVFERMKEGSELERKDIFHGRGGVIGIGILGGGTILLSQHSVRKQGMSF